MVKCDFCDFVGHARGIRNHLRSVHQLTVKKKTTVTTVITDSENAVKASETEILTVKRTLIDVSWLYEATPTADGKNHIRKKKLIQAVCSSLGITPAREKTGDDLRRESEEWLNSDHGKEYMAKHHNYNK